MHLASPVFKIVFKQKLQKQTRFLRLPLKAASPSRELASVEDRQSKKNKAKAGNF